MLLRQEGKSTKQISEQIRVNETSIRSWLSFAKRPKLAHYLHRFVQLGRPRRGWVWLSVNNTTRHAVPLGPFLEVPQSITRWEDVRAVLGQLRPLRTRREGSSSQYRFGFLLGIVIGDASKKRQRNWHRHIELQLSKRYDTSLRIGDFASICAYGIGIWMKRCEDRAPYGKKPNGFYVWRSQSTALVDWLYNVCLGLKDGELTTYSPVKMDWALEGTAEFRKGLIQGLAESDGSVNVSGQEVEFWIGPSWDFVRKLLQTFGLRSFRSREALTISGSVVSKAFQVPIFSPHLQTVRYLKFEKLARARHIPRGQRIPQQIRDLISGLGTTKSVPQISEIVLDEYGVILTYETVQRWVRKTKEGVKSTTKPH